MFPCIMVEELGSGTKRISKYTPLYANGQLPELYEDDYFTIVIPTPFAIGDTNSDTDKGISDTNNDTNKLTPADVIMQLIKENPVISAAQMSKVLGIYRRNTLMHLKKLKEAGRIIRVGTNKAGHWEVVES